MVKIEHSGYFKGGKLYMSNRQRFEQECAPQPDCDVDIIIKKKGKASSKSRRYYFGVVVKEITDRMKEWGNDVDEVGVHYMLKQMFNKNYVKNGDGEVIGVTAGTTKDHNIEERSWYIEACIQYAATQLDLVISAPNTQTQLFKVA